ncbi:hypothetical protein AV530_001194 [Patagioenas fasciata monilis]|uniref:Uncharacterized protein n=1 Tax=Patagioenas fasciata monilis TaxID=372326 RepID=A0A1V4KTU9_PATFA|nr:hypothetical protein AV530_001194 [Patagioenas fasciata monilis]
MHVNAYKDCKDIGTATQQHRLKSRLAVASPYVWCENGVTGVMVVLHSEHRLEDGEKDDEFRCSWYGCTL